MASRFFILPCPGPCLPGGWKSDKDLSEKQLRKLAHQHVVTTSYACAWFLSQKGLQRPFVICSNGSILEGVEQFRYHKVCGHLSPRWEAKNGILARSD